LNCTQMKGGVTQAICVRQLDGNISSSGNTWTLDAAQRWCRPIEAWRVW
jgi:hypothetical protein